MCLLKSVLPFLTNQAARFTSRGIGRSYFSGNFLLSFLLWYDFKILVKSRGGGTFLSLASSVLFGRSIFFFSWKLNTLSFIFLIWTEQFRIWLSQKLTKTIEISIVFSSFCYFTPCMSFESWFRSINRYYSLTRLSWHRNWQLKCCQGGARTHRKVKIPKLQR